MTSILTNGAAISALQTLRSISSNLETTQRMVSLGMRVGVAADNAAYWSISTTMKSDRLAVSAVSDALGLGAAKIDTAYAGMNAVEDLLSEIKSRIVSATEDGIDKKKVQSEIDQLKSQIHDVANSASFNGINFLRRDTKVTPSGAAEVASSFVRDDSGVSVKKSSIDLSKISLFTDNKTGLLEASPEGPGTIGGLREFSGSQHGNPRTFRFEFTGPLTFVDDTTFLRFEVEVDGDTSAMANPQPGRSFTVELNRSSVDAFDPSLNGVISTRAQLSDIMNLDLLPNGARSWPSGINEIFIETLEVSGLRGADTKVYNISSALPSNEDGGMSAGHYEGNWAYIDSTFIRSPYRHFQSPFTVDEGVVVSFDAEVDGKHYTIGFDRSLVNSTLSRDDGVIGNISQFAAVLRAASDSANAGLKIIAYNVGTPTEFIGFDKDFDVHPDSGSSTYLEIGSFRDNIPFLKPIGIDEVDVTNSAFSMSEYLGYVEAMRAAVESGASVLGSLQSRIDIQTEFTAKMMSTIDKGVGRLVDADMNEASTRLKALQTQQQLAVQSLSIANTNAENVMQLFR